jgi:hypothetical protein
MADDDIILEIRATREAFAAKHGYDPHAMVAELREKDAAGDRVVLSLEPRTVPTSKLPMGVGSIPSTAIGQSATIPS